MKKRLIALMLSAAMCVGMIGQTTFTAQAAEPAVETEKVQSQADEDPLAGVTGYATPLEAAENELLTPSPRLNSVPTEEQAYQAMIAMKAQYPEGMRWTNDNYYTWNGGIFDTGYGCVGFAFLLSDAAFGDLPARSILRNININKIHVGDILRINGDTHSVVCLARTANSITIAEGNYNSSIHWGRTLTAAQIAEITDYVLTRYPLGTFGAYYTISYAGDILPYQIKDEGEELYITNEIPTRGGYSFLGWATKSGSSQIAYRPGDRYAADADITLYPVWRKNLFPYNSSAQTQTIRISDTDISYVFVPTKTGYYTFQSNTATDDPMIEITNTANNQMIDADDTGTDRNFTLKMFLAEGTEYIVRFHNYQTTTGSYDVKIDYMAPDMITADTFPHTFATSVDSDDGHVYFFTPKVTDTYTFESFGSYDTQVRIETLTDFVASNDDSGELYNFKVSADLTAGTTYKITFFIYHYAELGTFDVKITRKGGGSTACQHTPVIAIPATLPTCTEDGHTELVICGKCEAVLANMETLPAYGHTWITSPGTAPTLFEEGSTDEVYCEECDVRFADSEVIPALKDTCGKLPVDMKKLPATTRVTAAGVGENAYWFIPEADGVYFFHSNYCPGVHFMVADDSHFLIDKVCSGGDLVSSQLLKKGVKYYIALGFLAERTDMTFDLTIAPEGSPEPPAPTNPFKDVSPSAWYYNYVLEANRLGIMTGTKPDTFNPAAKVTRGVFATVLYRLDGSSVSYKKYFPDVPGGVFYSEPITWAKESGVITGYNDGTFGPAKNVTREQIALILYRYTTEYRKFSSSTNADLSKFVDGSRVSSFARDGMKWAVANGIITGTADNRLNPQGTASRAEIATMIVRYISKFHP